MVGTIGASGRGWQAVAQSLAFQRRMRLCSSARWRVAGRRRVTSGVAKRFVSLVELNPNIWGSGCGGRHLNAAGVPLQPAFSEQAVDKMWVLCGLKSAAPGKPARHRSQPQGRKKEGLSAPLVASTREAAITICCVCDRQVLQAPSRARLGTMRRRSDRSGSVGGGINGAGNVANPHRRG